MKIIELLNKIANGEEVPRKFMVDGDTLYIGDDKFIEYENGERIEWFIYPSWLNEEVEIIEEDKKIEEINEIEYYHQYDECWAKDKFYKDQKGNLVDEIIIDKVNEIIKAINEMRENK